MSIISIIRIEYNIVKLIYPQQGTPARYATVFADEFMRKPGRYSTLPGIRAANVVAVVEHAVRGHNTSNPVKLCPVRNCETGHAAGGGPRVLGVGGGEGRLLRATGGRADVAGGLEGVSDVGGGVVRRDEDTHECGW